MKKMVPTLNRDRRGVRLCGCNLPSRATAVLVFLAAAAGAGIVATDLGGRRGRSRGAGRSFRFYFRC